MNDRALDVALSPALWLGIGVALACGLAFYLWRGGGFGQLLRDLAAALIGFAAGQAAGMALRATGLSLGETQVVLGTIGALLALWLGRLLTRAGEEEKAKPAQKAGKKNAS